MTNPQDALRELGQKLTPSPRARIATSAECAEPQRTFGNLIPSWYWHVLQSFPLVGRIVTVSGRLGRHDIEWMSPADMIIESFAAIPGTGIRAIGYVPVGACASGSGDPYFIRFHEIDDSPVVQVCHDVTGPFLVKDGELGPRAFEVVGQSIADVLERASSQT